MKNHTSSEVLNRTAALELYSETEPRMTTQYVAGIKEGYSVAITQVMKLLRQHDLGNGELYRLAKELDQ